MGVRRGSDALSVLLTAGRVCFILCVCTRRPQMETAYYLSSLLNGTLGVTDGDVGWQLGEDVGSVSYQSTFVGEFAACFIGDGEWWWGSSDSSSSYSSCGSKGGGCVSNGFCFLWSW